MNRTTILKRNGGGRSKWDRPHAGNGHVKTSSAVIVRSEDLTIPTYLPAAPDKNPMFLEKRVYQGS
ncbi:MAG TPA: hypothetical protein VIV82_08020, partial [Verrucomicrobiae bacterium]